MLRLLVPLFLLTSILWLALYAAPKAPRKKVAAVARQMLIALAIAGAVLCVITLVFYVGDLVHG